MDFKTTQIIPIPLPTEIPPVPKLDQLPPDVLHSASVEMLLHQIEDLSARLKVNIRMNSVQEQELLKLKRQIQTTDQRMQALEAKNLIVQEKENLWRSQKKAKNIEIESLLQERDLLKLRHNELYTASQFRQKELHNWLNTEKDKLQELKGKLLRQYEIKERGKEKIRQLLLQTFSTQENEQKEYRKLRGTYAQFKSQLSALKKKWQSREQNLIEKITQISTISKNQIHHLETKINDQQATIQNLEKKEKDIELVFQNRLVEEIELEKIEQRKLKSQITELESKISVSVQTEKQLQEAREESSSIKNKLTEMEAQISKVKEETNVDHLRSKDKLRRLQKDNLALKSQLSESKSILSRCEEQLLKANEQNQKGNDEIYKLKELWADTVDKLEKERSKNKNLNLLNSELSRQQSQILVEKKRQKSLNSSIEPVTTFNQEVTTSLDV